MYRLSQKTLALVIALLMGILPLQRAVAGVASSLVQGESVSRMADRNHGQMDMREDQAGDHCDQCVTGDCCADDICSTGACASVALALLAVFSLPTNHVTTSNIVGADDGFVSQFSASLFRPPRA